MVQLINVATRIRRNNSIRNNLGGRKGWKAVPFICNVGSFYFSSILGLVINNNFLNFVLAVFTTANNVMILMEQENGGTMGFLTDLA